MNNLVLEEKICYLIGSCFDVNDPNNTRNVIDKLLKMDSSRTLETLCLIVREITVNTIHGRQDAKLSLDSSLNQYGNNEVINTQKKATAPSKNQNSRLGTVALPKVIDYVEDSSQDGSGSDVPSQSSESSDDEQTVDEAAEELWRQTLPSTTSAHSDSNSQTHQDFFQSLVKDVESQKKVGESKWRSFNSHVSVGESHMSTQDDKYVKVLEVLNTNYVSHEVHLPHSHVLPPSDSPGLNEQIQIAIRSALSATDHSYDASTGSRRDSPQQTHFSLEVLNEISRAVIHHVGLSGQFANECEERINDTLIIFIGHVVHVDNCELLGAVVRSVIEKQLDKHQAAQDISKDKNEECDNDMGRVSERTPQHKGSAPSPKSLKLLSPSPSEGNHLADELFQEHQNKLDGLDDTDVFRYIQRTASHHLEINDSLGGGGERPGPGVDLEQEASVYEDSLQGDDDDHEEEEDYESGKVFGGKAESDEEEEAVDRANPPAWLMPKSPLDSVFRQGYGGLGHPDLSDVVTRLEGCSPVKSVPRDDVPAWLMPKSPMDSVFRQGYGGLGHPDLSDVVTRLEGSPAILRPPRSYNDSSSSDSDGHQQNYMIDDNDDVNHSDSDEDSRQSYNNEDEAEDRETDEFFGLTVDDLPSCFGRASSADSSGNSTPLVDLEIEGSDDEEEEDDDNVLGTDPDSEDEQDDDSTVNNNIGHRYAARGSGSDEDDDSDSESEEDNEDYEKFEMLDGGSEDELLQRMDDSFNSNTLLSFGLPSTTRHPTSEIAAAGQDFRASLAAKAESILTERGVSTAPLQHHATFGFVDSDHVARQTSLPLSSKSSSNSVSHHHSRKNDNHEEEDHHHAAPPSAFNTSTSLQYHVDGTLKLTGNSSLNNMMLESFKSYVEQYAQQGDKLHRINRASDGAHVAASANKTTTPSKGSRPEVTSSADRNHKHDVTASEKQSSHKSSTAKSAPQRFASLSPTVDYSFADLDDIIQSNLAKLEALKSPAPKKNINNIGRPATAASSQHQQGRHDQSQFDESTVFSFQPAHIVTEDLPSAVSKSWASPRSQSHYVELQRVANAKATSGTPTKGSARSLKKKNTKSEAPATRESSPQKKHVVSVRLSSASQPNLHVPVLSTSDPAVNKKRRPVASGEEQPRGMRSQSEIILSMDSSIESNEDLQLPAKTLRGRVDNSAGSESRKKSAATARPRSAVTSSGSSANNNQHKPLQRSKSPHRGSSSSLHAPTVTATMRSLVLAGGSADARVKQQSRQIQRSMDDEVKTGPSTGARRKSKGSK